MNNKNNVQIRKAVKEDCACMMQLVHELAEYEKAPHEVTVSFEHFVESGFGKNPVWHAFVATTQSDQIGGSGQIVGLALYYIRYSTWKGQRMYLEDLLVTAQMRGQGIGKLLFETLLDECRKKNYSGLVWQVLDWNEPAIRFYKKFTGTILEQGWINCSLLIDK